MIVVLGILITLAVILLLRPWARRQCRWREDRSHRGDQVRHVCVACGAVEILPPGQRPRDCLGRRPGS